MPNKNLNGTSMRPVIDSVKERHRLGQWVQSSSFSLLHTFVHLKSKLKLNSELKLTPPKDFDLDPTIDAV